ncbi:MAG: competence protein ComEA, partial [Candidatus Levybacteria bacterium CG10_big_fil_rev_8_21_14_0_10_36_30]
QKPGVFRLPPDARVQDALIAAGGISAQADRNFIEKSLNLAQKLTDGAKIYIPRQGEVATSTKLTTGLSVDTSQSVRGQININSATLVQLDTLPGVGQVIGQKIIDNRPYSDISQLVSKKIVSQKTFDKLKDSIGI